MTKDKEKRMTPEIRFKGFSDEWEQRKLGEVAEIVRGASPRPIQDSKWFDSNSDIGWLRISDVTEQNGRIYNLEQRISEVGQQKTRVLETPHLLLSIAATVGKPVMNYVKTGVHDGFLIFLHPKFNTEFVFQWLEMFRPQWQKYGQPGSQVNLNSELVRNQEASLPSMEEQDKVAHFFEEIDTTITLHQQKYDQLIQLKKAYLDLMFPKTGESTPQVRFADFHDNWEQRKLSEMANFSKGNGYSKADLAEEGHPVILYGRLYTKYETIIENVDTFAELKEKSVISNGGEVIVPASGETPEDISRASVVDVSGVALGGDLNIIKTKSELDPTFLALTISNGSQQKEMTKRAQGKSVVHLHNSDLKEVNLLYPKLDEQVKIGSFFKKLDVAITLHQKKIASLKFLKQAYLQKMFV